MHQTINIDKKLTFAACQRSRQVLSSNQLDIPTSPAHLPGISNQINKLDGRHADGE